MNKRLFLFFLSVFLLLLLGCKKKDSSLVPSSATPPFITGFSVIDHCARAIVIEGTGFNTDISKDSVFIGTVRAIIDSVRPNKMYIKFPSTQLSGNIKVFCNGLSFTSQYNFTFAPPIITSFVPTTAGPGTLITINGQNFNDFSSDSVFFNSSKAQIVSITSNQIVARVPENATSGAIKVYSHCEIAVSSIPFVFSNKGMVYASSNAGQCYSIDIASGHTVWTASTNSKGSSGPTYYNGMIYIGSTDVGNLLNNYMYALNAKTGVEVWKYQGGPFSGIALADQGVLYAGGYDKKLVSLNLSNGQKNWEFVGGDYFAYAYPTYADGKVFITNADGFFYCVNAASGSLVWKKMIWPGGNPSVVNGTVYIAGSGMLYALDVNDGTTKWNLQIPNLSISSPTVVNGVLYIGGENHRLYAINSVTGNVIWQREASWVVGSAVQVVNNILYVRTTDGVIGAVNATTSDILWSKALPGSQSGCSPVIANGILFVGDDYGTVNALNSQSGETIWAKQLGAYPIFSSFCVVDQNGNIFHSGDSGKQQ